MDLSIMPEGYNSLETTTGRSSESRENYFYIQKGTRTTEKEKNKIFNLYLVVRLP